MTSTFAGDMPGWWTIKSSIAAIISPSFTLPLYIQHRIASFHSFNNSNPSIELKSPQIRFWIQGKIISMSEEEKTMTVKDGKNNNS